MRATLIHNARAGGHRIPKSDEFVEAVEALGWKVTALDRSEVERAVANPGDVVIVGARALGGMVEVSVSPKAVRFLVPPAPELIKIHRPA